MARVSNTLMRSRRARRFSSLPEEELVSGVRKGVERVLVSLLIHALRIALWRAWSCV